MVEGINLYIPKSVNIVEEGLSIAYSKFLWSESLKIRGLKINY